MEIALTNLNVLIFGANNIDKSYKLDDSSDDFCEHEHARCQMIE